MNSIDSVAGYLPYLLKAGGSSYLDRDPESQRFYRLLRPGATIHFPALKSLLVNLTQSLLTTLNYILFPFCVDLLPFV